MIYFDCEATSPDPATAKVIQLAFLPDDGEPYVRLVNPGCPIPDEVQALTGIADAMVADAPRFRDVADVVAQLCDDAVLVGFGCLRFDVPLLDRELDAFGLAFTPRAVIDVGNLFKLHSPRNLAAAVAQYLGAGMPDAHKADADAAATRRVFEVQREQMEQLRGLTTEQMAEVSNYGRKLADPAGHLTWSDGRLCYAHKRICDQHKLPLGVPVETDPGYGQWMLGRDFPASTLRMLKREIDRIEAARPRDPEPAGLFD